MTTAEKKAKRLEDARLKALSYGQGIIPISNLPPHVTKQPKSKICDFCGQKCSVLIETDDRMYWICWSDICLLKDIYGTSWYERAKFTLHKNRQERMQKAAQLRARLSNRFVTS